MRYILDSSGYVESVSCTPFNCHDKSCTEYKGSIPSGYDTLQEWATTANIRAYKITNNNLVYDSAKDAELQAEWAKKSGVEYFSTDEVRIGEWIDGKSIYRKVIQTTLPSATSSWTVIANLGVSNIENIINFRGWFSWGGEQFFVIPMGEGSYFINLRMTKSGNIECVRNGWDALPAYIIVEYTKTTD